MGRLLNFPRDEGLRPYATDRQWEVLEAYWAGGTDRAAAKALDCAPSLIGNTRKAVLKKAAQRGYAPQVGWDKNLPDGMVLARVSDHDTNGIRDGGWTISKPEGVPEEQRVHLPDPKTISRLSTNIGAGGEVIQQWVQERPGDVARIEAWEAFATALAQKVERAKPVMPPVARPDSELLTVYPIGDHHFGMLAWADETLQESWDLQIAEDMLVRAVDYLVDRSPSSARAALVPLGDLFHFDGYIPETPASKNKLDADTRFPRMAEVVARVLCHAIGRLLEKHGEVDVVVESGNHDPVLSIMLRMLLAAHYKDESRVLVDTSPAPFHFLRHGKTLVMTHHGHGVKMRDLPLLMATTRQHDFAATEHRYIYTGHIHQDKVNEERGIRVESFRVLAPSDAWASGKGYLSGRQMQAIVLHDEFGEDTRITFTPHMLRS